MLVHTWMLIWKMFANLDLRFGIVECCVFALNRFSISGISSMTIKGWSFVSFYASSL